MKIVVIGAGAMGSIYGALLSTHNDVTLIDTNDKLIEFVRENGITIEESGINKCYFPKIEKDASSLKDVDLIILFTKALYSKVALDNVKSAIGDDTYLMTLQNGAGHENLLKEYVKEDHVIIGTTEDNGASLSLGVVHHGGSGVTNIGLLNGSSDPILSSIKEAFDASGFTVRLHNNIQQLIWDKLMTNVSLSVLTAILGCDMSYISKNENAFKICEHLVEEAVNVAIASGLQFSKDEVLNKVKATSEKNPGGYTSIMMDIKNGRKTEVDTISGTVVRKAHEVGVPVPHHEMAVSLIHALEGITK